MKKILFFLFIFLNISFSLASKPALTANTKEIYLYNPDFPKVSLVLGEIEFEDKVFLGKTIVVEIIRNARRLVDDFSTVGRVNIKSRFSYKRKKGYVKLTIYF